MHIYIYKHTLLSKSTSETMHHPPCRPQPTRPIQAKFMVALCLLSLLKKNKYLLYF